MLQGRKRQRSSCSPREKAVLEIVTDTSERPESATSIIDATRRYLRAPSFSVGVLHQGRTIFTKGFGYADLETGRVPDHNTIYGTGCCTKALTKTLLSLLEQSGRITWGAPRSEYLLWFRTPNSPDVDRKANLGDVLTHSTGFAAPPFVFQGKHGSSIAHPKDITDIYRHLPRIADFQKEWLSNGWSYAFAAHLVNQLSDVP